MSKKESLSDDNLRIVLRFLALIFVSNKIVYILFPIFFPHIFKNLFVIVNIHT